MGRASAVPSHQSFAALGAMALALAASAPAWPDSRLAAGPNAPGARAGLEFSIQVPAVTRVLSTGHSAMVAVSAADVARGYVDVDRARIEVLCNLRGVRRLVASVTAVFAAKVQITGLPEEIVASPEASTQLPARAGGVVDRRFDVRYRIHLAPGAAPGVYPWPLRLALDAI